MAGWLDGWMDIYFIQCKTPCKMKYDIHIGSRACPEDVCWIHYLIRYYRQEIGSRGISGRKAGRRNSMNAWCPGLRERAMYFDRCCIAFGNGCYPQTEWPPPRMPRTPWRGICRASAARACCPRVPPRPRLEGAFQTTGTVVALWEG